MIAKRMKTLLIFSGAILFFTSSYAAASFSSFPLNKIQTTQLICKQLIQKHPELAQKNLFPQVLLQVERPGSDPDPRYCGLCDPNFGKYKGTPGIIELEGHVYMVCYICP